MSQVNGYSDTRASAHLCTAGEISKTIAVTHRYHYLDNLRALAMLVGVFMHAALAYTLLMDQIWLVSNPEKSDFMLHILAFTHLFRMPLFFLIAGFFLHYLIQRRGIKNTLKRRSLRILLPLAIFLPILAISVMAIIGYAIETLKVQSPMLNYFIYLAQNPNAAKPPASTMHLWFLYHLFLFTLLAAIWIKFSAIKLCTLPLFQSPRLILTALPFVLVPALYSMPAPLPAPEHIYPELWSFGFYGIFFLLGWSMFSNQVLLDRLQSYWPAMLALCVIAYPAYVSTLPETFALDELLQMLSQGFSPDFSHLITALLEAFLGVYLTLLSLLVGRRYLNRANRFMRYLADASYWVYIIHLPVLLLIQYQIQSYDWGPWLKFSVSAFATLALGLISYALLIRWTPIGWMLNGRKPNITEVKQ